MLGGTVDSLTSAFGTDEFVFGHTDPLDANPGSPYARQLCIVTTGASRHGDCFAPIPEPGTGALVALGPDRRSRRRGAVACAAARSRRARRARRRRFARAGRAARACVATQIKVLSNRADLISGGDALVEIVPAPPPGR